MNRRLSWFRPANAGRNLGCAYKRYDRQTGAFRTGGLRSTTDTLDLVKRLDDIFHDFLGIAEYHHSLVKVEQRVVQPRVA